MQKAQPQFHENLDRSDEPTETASDRSFGWVMAGFFLLVGSFPLVFAEDPQPRWWAYGVSGAFFVAGWFRPQVLAPLNWVWTKIGFVLHFVVSPLVLGLLYYGTIVPIGMFMRWRGSDPLRLTFDEASESYWISRDPPGPAPDSMKNQY